MATNRLLSSNPFAEDVLTAQVKRSERESRAMIRNAVLVTLLWMLADILCVAIASAMALLVRTKILASRGALDFVKPHARGQTLIALAAFTLVLIVLSRARDLYGPLTRCSGLHEQRITAQTVFTAGLILAGGLYLARLEYVPRGMMLLAVVLSGVLVSARRAWWRYTIYRRHERGIECRNILIVGTGEVSRNLRTHLESIRHLGFNFKGYVQFSPADREAPAQEIVGGVHELLPLIRAHFVDEIFVATPCERGTVKHIVSDAMEAKIDVRVVPDLYDGLAWGAPVEYLGQFPTIPLHRRDLPVAEQFAKRAVDIVASALGLIVLSPLLLLLAVLVKLDSRGPVFYTGDRVGKKGARFRCVKFRTMVADADAQKEKLAHLNERAGVLFKIDKDPRITRLGRVLRRYSLDELPQLWNVLRGEMSLVGPRPPIASEVSQYELVHLRRLAVSPGITGLWQVEARQDPSFDSYISFDTAYVENWSLFLDFKILIRTIGVVLAGTGR